MTKFPQNMDGWQAEALAPTLSPESQKAVKILDQMQPQTGHKVTTVDGQEIVISQFYYPPGAISKIYTERRGSMNIDHRTKAVSDTREFKTMFAGKNPKGQINYYTLDDKPQHFSASVADFVKLIGWKKGKLVGEPLPDTTPGPESEPLLKVYERQAKEAKMRADIAEEALASVDTKRKKND